MFLKGTSLSLALCLLTFVCSIWCYVVILASKTKLIKWPLHDAYTVCLHVLYVLTKFIFLLCVINIYGFVKIYRFQIKIPMLLPTTWCMQFYYYHHWCWYEGYGRGRSKKEFKIENVMTKEMLSQHKRTTI